MKIFDLNHNSENSRVRVSAKVTFEDGPHPTHEIYFETEEEFSASVSSNPHAFLLAGAIPAMHFGEERVFIEGEVCPEIREGLTVAMAWLRKWYGPDRMLPRIEAKTRAGMPEPKTPERAGFFFSGGIDSFSTLRFNHLNYRPEHPLFIKDGLLVFGLEQDDPALFELVKHSLSGVARDTGITFIPVYTNIYLIYRPQDAGNGFSFWREKFMGAALASVAHVFAQRLTTVSIAASDDIANVGPYGSHPLIDPNYSSSDLRIRHDGIGLSRFEKTKLISGWEPALQNLRVCNRFQHYQPGQLNCGGCEKCVRTMLALLALGVLDKTRAFPIKDVPEELVRRKGKTHLSDMFFYTDLIEPLKQIGRDEIVRAIKLNLAEVQRQAKRKKLRNKIEELDSKYFNRSFSRLIHR